MRPTWPKPRATPAVIRPDGFRQMRDGEPRFLPMRRWENDRTLSAEMVVRCCDCGLQHMYTFNVLTDDEGDYFLLKRAYRLDDEKPKAARGRRGSKK